MTHPTVLVAAALALALTACGDSSDSDDAAACADGDGSTVTVEIGDFLFDPTPVEVERCDSVVWTNTHDQAHTSTGSGETSWTTGNLAPGASSEAIRFDTAGERAYLCALHPFMDGVVQVT